MDDPYLIWSNEHRAWWRPNHCGYTTSAVHAGRYSREAAIQICAGANRCIPADRAPNEIFIRAADAALCFDHDIDNG